MYNISAHTETFINIHTNTDNLFIIFINNATLIACYAYLFNIKTYMNNYN